MEYTPFEALPEYWQEKFKRKDAELFRLRRRRREADERGISPSWQRHLEELRRENAKYRLRVRELEAAAAGEQ